MFEGVDRWEFTERRLQKKGPPIQLTGRRFLYLPVHTYIYTYNIDRCGRGRTEGGWDGLGRGVG